MVKTFREAIPPIEYIDSIYWKDSTGEFFFNDETETEYIGPYKTLEETKEASKRYVDEYLK